MTLDTESARILFNTHQVNLPNLLETNIYDNPNLKHFRDLLILITEMQIASIFDNLLRMFVRSNEVLAPPEYQLEIQEHFARNCQQLL